MRNPALVAAVGLAALLASSASAQVRATSTGGPKLHEHMVRLVEERGPVKGWVFFRDKALFDANTRSAALLEARATLSERTLARRAARRTAQGLVDLQDVAVAPAYVDAVVATGAELVVTSPWLNAISVRADLAQFRSIAELGFVERIEPVRRGVLVDDWTADVVERPVEALGQASVAGGFYGGSEAQLLQVDLIDVHTRGYTGDGIVIGILDTGFHRGHEAFNQSGHVVDVLAEFDFVNNDANTGIEGGDDPGQHSHGTYILGTIGAYLPNEVVGAAYDASFILCKTEDTTNEYQQEEDFYVSGLQFIENNGADLATSSLGYIDWYTQSDLDGLTAVTTVAVNLATANGLVCLTAAGNAGHDTSPSTSALIAPADAFDVLTIGASDGLGNEASFSSDGPTADGRVKPELHAWGVGTHTVCSFTDVGCTTQVSGTSLSTPVMAGLVACLLEAHPNWTVGQLRARLFRTGDYFLANGMTDPMFVLGYGIPSAETAGFDCNANGIDDDLDLFALTSCDCNGNGAPDECDVLDGISADVDTNGRPDECTNSLSASPASISLATGGVQGFCFDAGSAFAGETYLLVGSASGSLPGIRFGGERLPLNADAYLIATLGRDAGSPLFGALGVLDAQGHATAQLAVPPGSTLFASGTTVRHALLVFHRTTSPAGSGLAGADPVALSFVSNVVTVAIQP